MSKPSFTPTLKWVADASGQMTSEAQRILRKLIDITFNRTGLEGSAVVTGTAGTSGNLSAWNANGDLVDANAAVGAMPDNTFRIVDNGDPTKKLAFEVSGVTTATTRTVTVPDASGTLMYASAIGVTVQAWDADLDDLATKWTRATSAGPASLDFFEDTDNGTNRLRVIAPAAIASDKTITWPDAAGTVQVDNTSLPVGYVRAWGRVNQIGTQSLLNSMNVSSITDLGVGLTQFSFTTAMPDATYSAVAADNSLGNCGTYSPATGSVNVFSYNGAFALTDVGINMAVLR